MIPKTNVAAIWLVVLGPVEALGANLIVNGSFEAPSVAPNPGPGNFVTIINGSSALTGWTVGLTSIDVVNGTSSPNPAIDGSQWLDLSGTPGPGSITQAFATTPSVTYELKFYHRFRSDVPNGTTAEVRVFNGSGDLLGPTILATPIPNWAPFVGTFVATYTTTSLQFRSLNTPDVLFGLSLDAVSVDVVPELSSFLLMSLGAVGLLRFGRGGRPIFAHEGSA